MTNTYAKASKFNFTPVLVASGVVFAAIVAFYLCILGAELKDNIKKRRATQVEATKFAKSDKYEKKMKFLDE